MKPKLPRKQNSAKAQTDNLGLERLIFFSDAVFAIAITLLTLDIHLPETASIKDDSQLLAQLTEIWHKYLGYIISFMVIGFFWMSHHRKFRFIKQYDNRLLILNLLVLMAVGFIPFPTSLISNYPYRTATILYALNMLVITILYIAIWRHATHHNRLIDSEISKNSVRREFVIPIATGAVFLLSIGTAWIDADIAKMV